MPKIPFQGHEVDAIEVTFRPKREDWNEYQLSDGTEIRMRLIVSDVFTLPGQYDQEGNPIYVIKSQNLVFVKAPDHLKKPKP